MDLSCFSYAWPPVRVNQHMEESGPPRPATTIHTMARMQIRAMERSSGTHAGMQLQVTPCFHCHCLSAQYAAWLQPAAGPLIITY